MHAPAPAINMEQAPATKAKINYGQIFQALPDLCVLLSPDLIILDATDSFLTITQTSRDIIGKSFFNVFPEDNRTRLGYRASLQEAWDLAIKNQKPYNIPNLRYNFSCPDGDGIEKLYWNVSGKSITDVNGQVDYILHKMQRAFVQQREYQHCTKESNEKTQVERELQESINHARKILDSLPLMTWTASSDGFITYYNQRWFEYTGSRPEEMGVKGWEKYVHPDDLERARANWLQAVKTGEPYVNQSRWRSAKDGQYRWFLGRGVPIRDDEGNITLWVGSHTDIEDQKQMMDALEESTRKFRFLAESIPQIVWTTNAQGYHDYFNQRWTDYTGLTLEDSLGTTWRHVLHPDDRKRTSERWKHSLRTGEYYENEYRFRNGRDGSYRWFLGQAMPMRDEQGNIIKWFGTCTDIEDHKRAEEELQEKNLELERINYDLDSFVYTASHDLKLPIINMAGIFQELTRSAAFTDPEAQRMIEMFNRSLSQIQCTISDLSEVVRVQKTKARDVEPVNLEELTEDIKFSIQDSLIDSGAKIYTDFSDAPTISFSKVNLKSILYNLISNAIKYRNHTRRPEIYLSTSRRENYVELMVKDNGLGIDMDKHQNKLFKMFKRFHNHVPGSGLGLYIVNRLLTNNGGYINVESKLNEGTTFYLYFKQK